MKSIGWITIVLQSTSLLYSQAIAPMRPPATPLIAHDPYFSVWSMSDNLTDQPTKHWTGSDQAMTGLIRIDGSVFRFMGGQVRRAGPLPALPQLSREVTPTRTIYGFEGQGIRLDLTFLTPALPRDLEVLSRPLTYVIFDVHSTDRRPHQVKIYYDCASSLVVNTASQPTMWSRHSVGDLSVIRLGSLEQKKLTQSGDDLRIDWGYLYLAAPRDLNPETLGTTSRNRALFTPTLKLPEPHDLDVPPQTDGDRPLAAMAFEFEVNGAAPVSKWLMLAYDDLYSIQYFQRDLRPYWRRKGMGAEGLLRAAERDYASLRERAIRFDRELTEDLVRSGGPKYAALAVLAYRETLAAHKLAADIDGTPLYFPKENFSNGCISTVDVIYPSAPFFLLLSPELLKAQLRPVLDYARSGRWPWPYAPHDLGQYPLANGQVYGGGELNEDSQMPVEESGNMLILMAALAKVEGNADFAKPYWPQLTRWSAYLAEKGLDPENQLSTDDFAGHLAHNTNLSIKAVIGLEGYARLAEAMGENAEAKKYGRLAKDLAAKWTQMASDGDHYRLAFDKPGTWSQKYNLVWDKLLGYKLFPPEVARKELAFYKTVEKPFGVPLDNRAEYTKLDWLIWTATLADNQRDFTAIADAAYRFANETSDRVPLSDWYMTGSGKHRGFQARSVVGGVFIKLLDDPAMWKKWSQRETEK